MNIFVPLLFVALNPTCISFSPTFISKHNGILVKSTKHPILDVKQIKRDSQINCQVNDDQNAISTDEITSTTKTPPIKYKKVITKKERNEPSSRILEYESEEGTVYSSIGVNGDRYDMSSESVTKRKFPPFAYQAKPVKQSTKVNLLGSFFGDPDNQLSLKDIYYSDKTERDLLIKSLLQKERSYARREPFTSANATSPPVFSDLVLPPSDSVYPLGMSGPVYRASIFVLCYASFPFITNLIRGVVTVDLDKLAHVTDSVLPGIAFAYGTFLTFTFDNLYQRQNEAQKIASAESALLANFAQGLSTLLSVDRNLSIKACQAIVDQITLMVKKSRGEEIINMIYSDPYSRLQIILRDIGLKLEDNETFKWGMIDSLQGRISELMDKRSERLSVEGISLPPIYFGFIRALTVLLIGGFIFSNLGTFPTDQPSWEITFIFAVLSSVYIQFNTFVKDLDCLFDGLYQIRRSTIAGHLLQIKWLISRQSFGNEIDFDGVSDVECDDEECYLIDTPGLGEVWMTNSVDARN